MSLLSKKRLHSRFIGSTVTMRSQTLARGVRENFDKNGAIWCNLGVPKYAITKLKINNFKVNKSTTRKVNCIYS